MKAETTLKLIVAERDRDLELVKRAQEGSRAAFDELFQRHKSFIYNVCHRILGSEEDAVDATQTAFIQAYKSVGGFRGGASFRSWLCRIAINVSNGVLRKEQRRRTLTERIEQPEEAETKDEWVWQIVRELPEEHRTALVLFYVQGLTGKEMADALGCSPGAARTRLHRAREAFRLKFEELGR